MMTSNEIWNRRRARWNAYKGQQERIAIAKRMGKLELIDRCDGCGRECDMNTNGLTSVCVDCKRNDE